MRAINAFKKGVLYHGENCNRGPRNDRRILEPALLLVNRWPYMTQLAGSFGARSIVCQLSTALCWCCCTMPKCSPAKRDFWDYGDNGGRKIKKSEEGASPSSSNVDQELVRSSCLFCVIATLSCIRGKLIWFLVQHRLTSLDFLEWKSV